MKRKILTSSLIILTALCLAGCSKTTKFEVKTKKDSTYITIPAEFKPSSEVPKLLIDAGFTKTDENDNDSVSYSISNEDYESFLSDIKESIQENVDTINSEENSSISEVKINKDMDVITAVINTESYKASDEDLKLNSLALKLINYKAYRGEKLSVKIKLINQADKEVYDTIIIEQ